MYVDKVFTNGKATDEKYQTVGNKKKSYIYIYIERERERAWEGGREKN